MNFKTQVYMVVYSIVTLDVFQKISADRFTDEKRPYEFGFSIEGEQHRHEKKDESGIIMGEFGFITADGIYHVTVYATDENGNFKILSMKNVRISAPLDGSPLYDKSPLQKIDSFGKSQGLSPSPAVTQRTTTVRPTLPPQQFTIQSNKPLVSSTTTVRTRQGCSNCNIPITTTTPRNIFQPTSTTTRASNAFLPSKIESNFGTKSPYIFSNNDISSPGSTFPNKNTPTASGGNQFIPFTTTSRTPSNFFQTTLRNGFPAAQPEIQSVTTTNNQPPPNAFNIPDIFVRQREDAPEFPKSPLSFNVQRNEPDPISNYPDQPVNVVTNQPILPTPGSALKKGKELHDFNAVFQSPQPIGVVKEGLPPGISESDVMGLLYKFNYTVGFHGHHETGYRNGDKIGDYFVNGRDGRSRQVTYTANENGYQPKVTFVNLGLQSPDTPKEETEKDYGLKGYEFKWFYER